MSGGKNRSRNSKGVMYGSFESCSRDLERWHLKEAGMSKGVRAFRRLLSAAGSCKSASAFIDVTADCRHC